MSEIRCGMCGMLITKHIDCEREKYDKLITEFLADLNEYWDNDYCLDSLIEKWEKKL